MISLRYTQTTKIKDFFKNDGEVREVRRRLDDVTIDNLILYDKAQRRALELSYSYYFD